MIATHISATERFGWNPLGPWRPTKVADFIAVKLLSDSDMFYPLS